MNKTFNFQTDVIEASKKTPIVVDFWAEWCAPCRMLGPVLEKLDNEANGRWKLIKINTEEHQQVAMEYGIRSIPAVKMFSDGQVVAEFVGALPEVQIKKWLDENIPTEGKKMLNTARAELKSGNKSEAEKLFRRVLELEPQSYEARIPLAFLLLEKDVTQAYDLIKDIPEDEPLFSNAQPIQVLARLHVEWDNIKSGATDTPAWKDYLSGINAFQQKDYETALQNWIDAIVVDKTIDDDGPRKACIALFALLGQEHALTQKYHRRFTSALF